MDRRQPLFYVLVLLGCALLPISVCAQTGKSKIILDTDIGDDIDDAWAMGFVISYQGFAPLGITITHGNTPARAKIACKLLHITHRDDIPVSSGARRTIKFFSNIPGPKTSPPNDRRRNLLLTLLLKPS